MKALKDQGLDRNTLVVFTSDNGPAVPPRGPGSAGPYSGGKGSCEEGGVRVPGIMRWPARIRAGRVVSEPVSTLDLFPTLVALTGAELPARPYDGLDISRLLTGEVDRIGGQGIDGGREIVFWQQDGVGGLRSGKWKYLRPGLWSGTPTLFDLEADPGEKNDLYLSRPGARAAARRAAEGADWRLARAAGRRASGEPWARSPWPRSASESPRSCSRRRSG